MNHDTIQRLEKTTLSTAVWRVNLRTPTTTKSNAGAQEEQAQRSTDSIRAAAERSLTYYSAIRPSAAHPDSNDVTVSIHCLPQHHLAQRKQKKRPACKHAQHSGSTRRAGAAQIASEQQQNAVLLPAQRFAPAPHTQTATTSQSVYTASLNTISRTQRKQKTGLQACAA